jgi:hypothetical protein
MEVRTMKLKYKEVNQKQEKETNRKQLIEGILLSNYGAVDTIQFLS